MRRRLALFSLCLAWLCANGALWNIVQVVAWAKMYHAYSQVMPAAQALRITFDGSAPCDLCVMAGKARDAGREQLPREAAPGATAEKIILLSEAAAPFVVGAPDSAWPGVVSDTGLRRTEAVPLPPPRV